MFDFFKKKAEIPKKDEVETIDTYNGSYTKDEYEKFKKEMSSFKNHPIVVEFYDNREHCPRLYNRFGSYGKDFVSVDLKRHNFDYYLSIMKTAEFLSKCSGVKYSIRLSNDNVNIESCEEFTFERLKIFDTFRNFHDGSTFVKPKQYIPFHQSPRSCVSFKLSDCDEVKLSAAISNLPEMKKEYEKYCFEWMSNYIKSIIEQFPEEFFQLTITDGNKTEEMFSMNAPKQCDVGSFRIDDVLFLEDYFTIIPSVMYRIDIVKMSREDIANAIIGSCSGSSIKRKLLDVFVAK